MKIIFDLTRIKPRQLLFRAYILSFKILNYADNVTKIALIDAETEPEFPYIGEHQLNKREQQFRKDTISFWRTLKAHAFSLINFNKFIYNKYNIICSF